MESEFAIADPRDDTRGGHLNFTIHDGTAKIPGRISSAAMRLLADNPHDSPTDVFNANKSKIRLAAYKSRRFNPRLPLILLSLSDFT
jgi:hypothetical protein